MTQTPPKPAPTMIVDTPKPRSKRGFAAMDPVKRLAIARKGGASVKSENRSFSKDRNLAQSAGKKGGLASRGGGRSPKRGGPKDPRVAAAAPLAHTAHKYDGN